jgi:hypothetical protein
MMLFQGKSTFIISKTIVPKKQQTHFITKGISLANSFSIAPFIFSEIICGARTIRSTAW